MRIPEDLIEFLTGDAEGEDPQIWVDDMFAKPFKQLMAQAVVDEPLRCKPVGPVRALDRRMLNDTCPQGYRIGFSDLGDALLFDPSGNLVGAYLGMDLSIDANHQGMGLGRALIIERFIAQGDLPNWWADKPAYTFSGQCAHESAWRWLREHEEEIHRDFTEDANKPHG